jgi:23S rRNA pseudouridine2605 synthase
MPEERIQKVIAAAGVASRRQAEVLVSTGRVRIDGKVAVVGQKVDPMVSTIDVNGTPIGVGVARAYVALHKPAGVTSTTRDRHADRTVLDLIPTALVPDGTRLYPVGRLDLDSEGLLLLTNDGDWAERVLHPRFGVEREYALALAHPLTPEQVRLLNAGIRLDEGVGKLSAPLRATTSVENRQLGDALDPAPDRDYVWYRATLAQGWKRQLRRMFGAIDAPILRLVRVRIGIVRLGDLRSGRTRILKAPEVKAMAGLASSAPIRQSAPAPRAPGRPAPAKPQKGRPQGARKPAPKVSDADAPDARTATGRRPVR